MHNSKDKKSRKSAEQAHVLQVSLLQVIFVYYHCFYLNLCK